MAIKAKSLKDAEALLHSGISKVELAYDIGSDSASFRLFALIAIKIIRQFLGISG